MKLVKNSITEPGYSAALLEEQVGEIVMTQGQVAVVTELSYEFSEFHMHGLRIMQLSPVSQWAHDRKISDNDWGNFDFLQPEVAKANLQGVSNP